MCKRVFGVLVAFTAGVGSALAQQPAASPSRAMPVLAGTPLLSESPLFPEPLDREPAHESEYPQHGPPGYSVYGRADFLWWWLGEGSVPPLASTGVLDAPGTVVLVSDLGFDNGQRLGARVTVGTWLTNDDTIGMEVTGIWLAERSPTIATRLGKLGRPFFDVAESRESAAILAEPGLQAGALGITATSRLWSAESNLRVELCRRAGFHLDVLGGFRYLRFDDILEIQDRTEFGAATVLLSSDRFSANNQFLGGQLGLEAELSWGRFFLNGYGKLALGATNQVVRINGTTTSVVGATSRTEPFGLLARPSNSGRFEHNEFSVLPEAGVNIGLELTTQLRLTAGYTVLYLTDTVRGGEQIDRVLNPGPGAEGRPVFFFRDGGFWAQGLNVGLEFRF